MRRRTSGDALARLVREVWGWAPDSITIPGRTAGLVGDVGVVLLRRGSTAETPRDDPLDTLDTLDALRYLGAQSLVVVRRTPSRPRTTRQWAQDEQMRREAQDFIELATHAGLEAREDAVLELVHNERRFQGDEIRAWSERHLPRELSAPPSDMTPSDSVLAEVVAEMNATSTRVPQDTDGLILLPESEPARGPRFQLDPETLGRTARTAVTQLAAVVGHEQDPLGSYCWWTREQAWLGAAPAALLGTERESQIAAAAERLRLDAW